MTSSIWTRFGARRNSQPALATDTHGYSRAMCLTVALLVAGFSGDLFRYTVGWPAYAVLVVVLTALAIVVIKRRKPQMRILHLPYLLLGFAAWCWCSALWSRYPAETLLAATIQLITVVNALMMAVSLERFQFLRALGVAMRGLIYGSLAFELLAAILAPNGVLPPIYLHTDTLSRLLGEGAPSTPDSIPGSFYWTHSAMFIGGPVQGLMGNRNLLAFVAVLAIIATAAEWADGIIDRLRAIAGLSAAALAILLTDSATAYVSLLFVGLGVALVAIGRRLQRRHRWMLYGSVGLVLIVGATVVITNNNEIFALMNRSSDMSGRGTIWRAVLELGSASPWVGIGWISYWAPWIPEFSNLAVFDGVAYHQAHNAFLDVWMQTGAFGVLAFTALVITALIRTWWLAIDPHDVPLVRAVMRQRSHAHPSFAAAVPFLLMVALVVQAMTESRLLIEGNWMLLVYLAIFAKFRSANAPHRPRPGGTVRHANERVALDLREP